MHQSYTGRFPAGCSRRHRSRDCITCTNTERNRDYILYRNTYRNRDDIPLWNRINVIAYPTQTQSSTVTTCSIETLTETLILHTLKKHKDCIPYTNTERNLDYILYRNTQKPWRHTLKKHRYRDCIPCTNTERNRDYILCKTLTETVMTQS